jgi:hypothetical protein
MKVQGMVRRGDDGIQGVGEGHPEGRSRKQIHSLGRSLSHYHKKLANGKKNDNEPVQQKKDEPNMVGVWDVPLLLSV